MWRTRITGPIPPRRAAFGERFRQNGALVVRYFTLAFVLVRERLPRTVVRYVESGTRKPQ